MILLYVDDSVTMQRIAEITLAGTDFEYVGARTVDEALAIAAERKPALVLADAVMPTGTGYDLCAQLRARGLDAPVLIVCGNSEAYDAARGEAAGASGTIAKPWDTELILALLHNHVHRRARATTPPPVAQAPAPSMRPIGSPRPADFPPAGPMKTMMVAPSIALPPPAEPAPAPDKPRYVDDNVQFTVYRPKVMAPARWHPLLAFAHLADKRDDEDEADPIEEVQRQAAQVLGADAGKFTDTTQDATASIPREGELTIVPELAGFDVNPKARTFLWTEPVHREEFRIRAGAALDGQTVRGKVTVWLGSLIVAEVPLAIRVTAGATDADGKPAPAKARPYRKIFASYSHRDAHVVDEVSRLARALGDEYTRDWVHLRSGQVWNDQLRTLIAEADIFQLFWSSNSMRSRFCRDEWEYALSLGRPSFVRPTYWEEPLPRDPGADMPPDELVRLHFQKIRVAVDWAPPPKLAEAEAEAEAPTPLADDAPKPSAPPPGMASYGSSAPVIVDARERPPAARPPWLMIAILVLVAAAAIAWFALR